jgi:hypothetical protein
VFVLSVSLVRHHSMRLLLFCKVLQKLLLLLAHQLFRQTPIGSLLF